MKFFQVPSKFIFAATQPTTIRAKPTVTRLNIELQLRPESAVQYAKFSIN